MQVGIDIILTEQAKKTKAAQHRRRRVGQLSDISWYN